MASGSNPGPGRHRPGDRDGRDVQTGWAVRCGEEFCERSDPGFAQRQARCLGPGLGHAAGDDDRAGPVPHHLWREVGGGGDRTDDVHGPGVEVLLGRELAEAVRLDQRGVVHEQLRDAEAIDDLVERRAQYHLVGDVRGYAKRVVVR